MMTAADDRIIPRNPCRIKGADEEKPDERPVLTVAQVFQLADLVPERLRALVLLATFASLRWGEAAALRRMDLDLNSGTVSVRQQHVELDTGELLVGPPKSRAGVRTVAIPSGITPVLEHHLASYTGPEDDALIFTGSRGGILRWSTFRRAANWAGATRKIGVPGLHFHDLRHTGNTLATGSGASLRDLMERMGARQRADCDDLSAQYGGGGPEDRRCDGRQDRECDSAKASAHRARSAMSASGTLMARAPFSEVGDGAVSAGGRYWVRTSDPSLVRRSERGHDQGRYRP
ncbi:hypothetical protein GCM10022226_13370 [Sphaerisporangium flaviroseum]|uniref:Tyr recombinase domain-containing protein n=1 Tax=Sphaerisporangium flaviroseum TaxID=509199 RepID=A0ABP7HKJ9_9ACTN